MPADREARFHCPRCGSARARRSGPHSLEERLLRAFTPLRTYRCRDCGHRGWRWGGGRVWLRRARTTAVPGRPPEKRDMDYLRRRRLRRAFAVLAAIGLGAAAGVFLQKCGQSTGVFINR